MQPEKVSWRDSQMCTILGGGGQNPTPLHFGLSKDMQMFYAVNIGLWLPGFPWFIVRAVVQIAEACSLPQAELFGQTSSCDKPVLRTKPILKYWQSSKDEIPCPPPTTTLPSSSPWKVLLFTKLCFHQLFSNRTPKQVLQVLNGCKNLIQDWAFFSTLASHVFYRFSWKAPEE